MTYLTMSFNLTSQAQFQLLLAKFETSCLKGKKMKTKIFVNFIRYF